MNPNKNIEMQETIQITTKFVGKYKIIFYETIANNEDFK